MPPLVTTTTPGSSCAPAVFRSPFASASKNAPTTATAGCAAGAMRTGAGAPVAGAAGAARVVDCANACAPAIANTQPKHQARRLIISTHRVDRRAAQCRGPLAPLTPPQRGGSAFVPSGTIATPVHAPRVERETRSEEATPFREP